MTTNQKVARSSRAGCINIYNSLAATVGLAAFLFPVIIPVFPLTLSDQL